MDFRPSTQADIQAQGSTRRLCYTFRIWLLQKVHVCNPDSTIEVSTVLWLALRIATVFSHDSKLTIDICLYSALGGGRLRGKPGLCIEVVS